MKRALYFLPLVIFAVLAAYFYVGLGMNPRALPNMLDGKPVPAFDLAPIKGSERGFASKDLLGKVSLVNIFGSWCYACQAEHPFLMRIKQEGWVPIYGIDWREKDADAGPRWLRKWGDPYTLIGDDPNSRAAIAFGVTGAPETFLVDQRGVVRYKQIGPITPEIWEETLWPLIQELRKS